jgi:hypothetical protein
MQLTLPPVCTPPSSYLSGALSGVFIVITTLLNMLFLTSTLTVFSGVV